MYYVSFGILALQNKHLYWNKPDDKIKHYIFEMLAYTQIFHQIIGNMPKKCFKYTFYFFMLSLLREISIFISILIKWDEIKMYDNE